METNFKKYKIMKWIVYQTLNTVNNKIYIGVHKTENPDVFDGYLGCSVIAYYPSSYNHPETPFQCAVKKYGPGKFKRSVLKVFDSFEEAYSLEAELVNRDFIKRKDTYNIHLGGIGGRIGKSIKQFDFSGKLIKTWDLVQDAADFYHCDWMTIYYAYLYKVSRKGFYWSYDDNIDITKYVNATPTTVYKYDGNTLKCVDMFFSQHDAAKKNNIQLALIQRAVKGGYKVGDYYYSSNLMDEFDVKKKLSIAGQSIYIYDLNGTFLAELKTKEEQLKFFNVKNTGALRYSLRTNTQYKDYQLSLIKVNKMEPIKDKRKVSKKVGRYSLSGDLLEIYDTVTKAREAHGVGVSRCLRGQQKQCHSFIFKYM